MSTDNAIGADNQQERSETIGWIVGFTDGEGCFSVSIVRNKTSSLGWQVMPEFVITQGEKSLSALYKFKDFFGCGNIFINRRYDNHTENLYRFCIRSLKDINEKVVPFFRKYPLQTAKSHEFDYFAKIMDMIKKKEHLTLDGITEIVKIASLMNVKKPRVFLKSSDTNTSESPQATR